MTQRQHIHPGTRLEALLQDHGFQPASIAGCPVTHLRPETDFIGVLRHTPDETLLVGLLKLSSDEMTIYAYGLTFETELKRLLVEATQAFEVASVFFLSEDEERPIDADGSSYWSSVRDYY